MSPSTNQSKTLNESDAEELVRGWGFSNVFTWHDTPHRHYPPHTHSMLTTHYIIQGEIRMKDYVTNVDKRYQVGDRCDVGANARHEAWAGSEGCTYVIGEK